MEGNIRLQGGEFERPFTVKIDAAAAIGFINNTGSGGKMKHLDIREAWIQQMRDRKVVQFEKCEGTENLADFFTKLYSPIECERACARLMHPLPEHVGRTRE